MKERFVRREITVYQILIDGLINTGQAHKVIEEAVMTGDIPRPVIKADFPVVTDKETMLFVAGCVGNYSDRIIKALKESGFNARFISDEEAEEVEKRENIYI
jgi:hypothetical protein